MRNWYDRNRAGVQFIGLVCSLTSLWAVLVLVLAWVASSTLDEPVDPRDGIDFGNYRCTFLLAGDRVARYDVDGLVDVENGRYGFSTTNGDQITLYQVDGWFCELQ